MYLLDIEVGFESSSVEMEEGGKEDDEENEELLFALLLDSSIAFQPDEDELLFNSSCPA